MSLKIHPTALVDARAELDSSVEVGPYAIVGPHVQMGAGCRVGPHAVIEGHTRIGQNNQFFQFVSIGAEPQDKKYAGEPTRLDIGDGNTFREFVTVNTGTVQDAGITRIGDDNWVMAYVHIAHDCQLGSHTTLANNTTLAGHVQVGDWVTIGGLTGVLQRMRIGAYAMVGFQAHVNKDVPPFMTVDGNPLSVRGVNLIGLKRREFSDARLAAVREMHKLLYRQDRTLDDARAAIVALGEADAGVAGDAALMDGFLAGAANGIVR
jgi:UDP-N-acetylglucosamine acyltransferase